jgi:hypothetical protein
VGPDVDNQADIGIVAADNLAALMCVAMVASKQRRRHDGSRFFPMSVHLPLATAVLSFARSIVVSISTHDLNINTLFRGRVS